MLYCILSFSFLCLPFFYLANFHLGSEENVNLKKIEGVNSSFKDSSPLLGIKEYVLSNGMKIILKPTDFEPHEVLVRIMALGGFSCLPAEKLASGRLASAIAWESGAEERTLDQLSVTLYEYSMEFEAKIDAFSRLLEGMANEETLLVLLKIMQSYFTHQHFTYKAFQTVVKQYKEGLIKNSALRDNRYEETFKSINTQNYAYLAPLTKEAIDKANFEIAKEFFYRSFRDPSQFVCVIVGDFDSEKTIEKINNTLGTIPKCQTAESFIPCSLPHFPQRITTKLVPFEGRSDSLARITFPLNSSLDPQKLQTFQTAIQVLEHRLRNSFREKTKSAMGINVCYEFPVYPLAHEGWLVIQYRCSLDRVFSFQKMILTEFKNLCEKGPLQEELDKVLANRKREDGFWLNENSFWAVTLTYDYLRGWGKEGTIKSYYIECHPSTEEIKNIIKDKLNLNNYSIIYSKP